MHHLHGHYQAFRSRRRQTEPITWPLAHGRGVITWYTWLCSLDYVLNPPRNALRIESLGYTRTASMDNSSFTACLQTAGSVNVTCRSNFGLPYLARSCFNSEAQRKQVLWQRSNCLLSGRCTDNCKISILLWSMLRYSGRGRICTSHPWSNVLCRWASTAITSNDT